MIRRYFSMIREEFSGYNSKKLTNDLMAGLTVCAVALPLALAFGVSSGADASAGLITAIISGVVISLLSGAYYQISGPTGAMAAILVSIVAKNGLQGMFAASFIAGILLLLASILKLGRLASWIPAPVVTGFTSGIAIIILLGQIDSFFFVASEGENVVQRLLSYKELGFRPDLSTVGIGLFVILLMLFFPKKWNRVVPASLVGIVLATLLSALLRLDVAMVGEIPQRLFSEERLHLSFLTDFSMMRGVLSPAISIALLGLIESLLCGASAGKMAGKPLDGNQELFAQGIGNIIIPFFGGVPATAAIARTSVAVKSKARTRLTGIIHAVGLLLSMFLLAPVMSKIPMSALSAVLMVTAFRMNDWRTIKSFFSKRIRSAMVLFTVTMISTVVFDLSIAILIGIGVGFLFFVGKCSDLQIAVENVDFSRVDFGSDKVEKNWVVVYITGPLFFMTSENVKNRLQELKEKELVILSLRGVPLIDVTTLQVFSEFYQDMKADEKTVLFSSLQPSVVRSMKKDGLYDKVGEKAFFFSVEKALYHLKR